MFDVTTPTAESARVAETALRTLTGHPVGGASLHVCEDGKDTAVALPDEVLSLLVHVLGQMANGNGVRVGERRECVRVHVSERASLCIMR